MPKDIQQAETQTMFLEEWDPDGDTWVKIKPPGFEEARQREELLKKRKESLTEDGTLAIETSVNNRTLWAWEIALTFAGTNLTANGKPLFAEDTVSVTDFLTRLGEINPPDELIREWVLLVREVVPDWRFPFR